MGKSIQNKDDQLTYLKDRLTLFMEVIDRIEPETAELEDIDRLIEMIDDIEVKVEQFKKRSES
ncbi:SE1561 family protein [Bacillus massiliglaciei]|uniref:SE1561 family protein n=1 Tax=Bacillus massiliglaciei TaxID=1816693 RepID=UPI000A698D62|nr:SE1561 family protein [Bacillus massiliglaciei]